MTKNGLMKSAKWLLEVGCRELLHVGLRKFTKGQNFLESKPFMIFQHLISASIVDESA